MQSYSDNQTYMKRPFPPGDDVLPPYLPAFAPAPDLAAWVSDTFLTDGECLYNPDHDHLRAVRIGFLWAGAASEFRGKRILGTARLITPAPAFWPRLMAEWQLLQWFGNLPLALIVIDAEYAREAGDADFCALIEHELYHLGQDQDEFGMPRFRRDGSPRLAMRSHDVEEFIGVVRRYGAGAAGESVRALVSAANQVPEIADLNIRRACGTCQLKSVA